MLGTWGKRLMSRAHPILVGLMTFLLALGVLAVSAAACGSGGGAEPTTLTTTLSGEGKEGETLTVLEGSRVKDKATLSGKNASSATGKVTYDVYAESACKTLITEAGEVTVSGASVPASSEKLFEGGTSYYWQAVYSGDSKNSGSTSSCTEISTTKAETKLSTTLSGEGKEGEKLTVLEGSAVKDKVTLEGTNASTATGTFRYRIYSDGKCEHLIAEAGEVTVTGGSVPASSEETLTAGASYYWQAYYEGDSLHQASKSACGAEIATVKAEVPTGKEKLGGGSEASKDIALCFTGDTINCATGNLTEEQTDDSIGGRGPGLRVVRSYNSTAAAEATSAGAWGYGWTGPYGAHLEVNGETAIVYQENGSDVVFYKSGSTYAPASWVQATLVVSGSDYIYTLPDQTKLEFNSEGRLVTETERNGNSITLAYNGSHQLETAADGDSRTLTFKYNGGGEVESVKDPMGHLIEYTYSSGNLASVKIEGKVRWEFEYESPHLLKKLKDGRGDATTYEYDGSHRVVKQVAAGHERKWKYGSPVGAETTLTEPNGSETVETFNNAGEPAKVTRAVGVAGVEVATEYEYNNSYELVKQADPNGHKTEYGYDPIGDKTSEKDPNSDEKKWKYDSTHDVETETTPEGEATAIKRDGDGDMETIERTIGSEVQKIKYAYNGKGDLTEETNPLGYTTKYTYNAAGDRESEKGPEGDERKWKYNEDSQEIEETSPRGYTTTTERSEQGRPTKVIDPLAHTAEYTYDGDGDVETETDGDKHTTKYIYNEENLPTKVEEPDGDDPETGYDSEGEMTSRTDGNGHKWEYKRNQLEQITEEVNQLGKKTKKKYEKAGNTEALEDPEGHTTTYKYDESSRLTAIKYSTGTPSEATYEYNKDSQVVKMTDETGTTTDSYDKLGRLTEYKNGAGKVVKYEYNLDDEPTAITYPNGKAVTREYDHDGRLSKVTDWNSNATSFHYNPDSELTATGFPAGTEDEDTYAYNEADEMTEVKMLKGATTLGSLAYTRGGDSEVKKTTTTVLPGPATSEYTYDEGNRLTEAGGAKYEYDDANNPTKIEGAGGYTYNEADELKEGPSRKYLYDSDGQRTETKPTSGQPTTYGYDQAGNLTSAKRLEEAPLAEINDSYTYDGDNLRQSQTINGTTTHLTWDTAESTPIVLTDEADSYIYGPDNLPIEQIASGGETLYLHHDQQGSTRLLTNTSGETEAAYTYDPYGALEATTGTAATPLRYDAQYTNANVGLAYLHARTYDPQTAQFLSIDPALQTTGEPYSYGADDPLNAGDPTGLDTWGVCAQVSLSIPILTGSVLGCLVTDWANTRTTLTVGYSAGYTEQIGNVLRTALEGTSAWRSLALNLRGAVQWSNAPNVGALVSGASTLWQGSINWGFGGFWGITGSYTESRGANGRISRTFGVGASFAAVNAGFGRSYGAGHAYTWVW